MISQDEIKKIANLARLDLTDEEVVKFSNELSSILDYFEKLNELDTENEEMTLQITGIKNSPRTDAVEPSSIKNELLNASENEISDSHIRVKNVF
ncbi:MAG: Asp-tRNA(Asn)/Glu-tRNA(Gln) amidotransferase subunit GatC [Candidatus Gracilibacteria bacterium]|jgi:aspartyl-tRNA(Asn)/glutamyl-tRNA(Gln) amidotransferase subunit C|nr:Asp-tRNA(Asn)/Glu-tRNA(Gln) amidotransferase subunit GatC [Candidatus Gracilibacteria bacterium]